MGKSEDPKETKETEQPKDPKDYFQFVKDDNVEVEEEKTEDKTEAKPDEAGEKKEQKPEDEKVNAETPEFPERFIVKNEDGSINWTESAKKAGKSWQEGEKLRGRQGQVIGDLKKEREQFQKEIEQEISQRTAQEPKEEITAEKVIEWLDKNPEKLVDGIASDVIARLQKSEQETQQRRIKDTQIFQNEVLDYLEKHPEIENHYEKMVELFNSKPKEDKNRLMRDVSIMMDVLLKEVRIAELEEISKKKAYEPDPPKEEEKGIAGDKTKGFDKLKAAGMTEKEIAFARGFGLSDEQILKSLKRSK